MICKLCGYQSADGTTSCYMCRMPLLVDKRFDDNFHPSRLMRMFSQKECIPCLKKAPSRAYYFVPIPMDDSRRTDIQNKIAGWLGNVSGPYRVEHKWTLVEDGLPVLRPTPFIAEDLHLLGKGIDPKTETGGFSFIVSGQPRETEECILLMDTYKKRHRCTIIFDDKNGESSMYEIMARLPAIYYESGGSIIHGFFHRPSGTFFDHDLIVLRGRHLCSSRRSNDVTAVDRRSILRGPIGIDSLAMRNNCREELAVFVMDLLKLPDRPERKTDELSISREDVKIDTQIVEHDTNTLLYDFIIEQGIEYIPAVSLCALFQAKKDQRLSDEMKLCRLEIRIRCLPTSIYPNLPLQWKDCKMMYFRGAQDYQVAFPQLYGCIDDVPYVSVASVEHSQEFGSIKSKLPRDPSSLTLSTSVGDTNPLPSAGAPTLISPPPVPPSKASGLSALKMPSTLYFCVQTDIDGEPPIYLFHSKSTGDTKQAQLFLKDDISIYAMASIDKLVLQSRKMIDQVVVKCLWNPKANEYTVVGFTNACADNLLYVNRRNTSQKQRLDMKYILNVQTTIEEYGKRRIEFLQNTEALSEYLERLIRLVPGLNAPHSSLLIM